jgi:hypothetical protein
MPHLLSSPTGGKDVRHGRFLLSEQICGTIDGFSFGLAWGGDKWWQAILPADSQEGVPTVFLWW